MNQQERALVWLARKIDQDEDLIERLEDYMDSHHRLWSKEVTIDFLNMLEEKKRQMWYETHRLEKMAWQIAEDRENSGTLPDREALVVFNKVTGGFHHDLPGEV